MAVHRIVEERASIHADRVAVADGSVTLSYRELNQHANALARHLVASGFRRGAIATVRLPRSADAAIVLLGILKAGGTYALVNDAGADHVAWPPGVSFAQQPDGEEVRVLTRDELTSIISRPIVSAANLPIVSRPGDVACVLRGDADGTPVLVPHATITALHTSTVVRSTALPEAPAHGCAQWGHEPGALDLWVGLMTGRTVTLDRQALQAAA